MQQATSHKQLLYDLKTQGVLLSLVGETGLHIKGEMTPAQKESVRFWKPQLIELLSSVTLTGRLNRMIEAGASFDVATDDFQVFGSENLTELDKYFLEQNKTDALCHLQQSLLTKHSFRNSPEQFEAFACDIAEREAIMTEDGEESFSIHCAAVKSVTAKWFGNLLQEL